MRNLVSRFEIRWSIARASSRSESPRQVIDGQTAIDPRISTGRFRFGRYLALDFTFVVGRHDGRIAVTVSPKRERVLPGETARRRRRRRRRSHRSKRLVSPLSAGSRSRSSHRDIMAWETAGSLFGTTLLWRCVCVCVGGREKGVTDSGSVRSSARFFLRLARFEAENDPESPIGTPLITRVVGKFTRATRRRSSPFNPPLSGEGISFVSACFCEGSAGRNRLHVHQIGFGQGCN